MESMLIGTNGGFEQLVDLPKETRTCATNVSRHTSRKFALTQQGEGASNLTMLDADLL